MSVAVVPLYRATPNLAGVRIGVPVAAGAWRDALWCNHFVMGRGRQLVPAYSPNVTISAGTNRDFRHRVLGSYGHVLRRWSVWAISPSKTGVPSMILTAGATASPARTVGSYRQSERVFHAKEVLAAQSATEVDAVLNIAVTESDVKILGIACAEYPRFSLDVSGASAGTTDDGARPETLAPGEIMADRSYESIEGVVEATANAWKSLRRSLYYWARPANTTDAKAFAAGWADGIPLAHPVLGYKKHKGDTTITVNARVYAFTTAGGGGEVRFNTASGGTAVATIAGIAGTTPTWYPSTAGAPASFSIQCEDLTASDGRQAATFEALMWQAQRTAGTCYVAGVDVWIPTP